ncbi:hypothetical protein GOD83_05400 [Sinorhizobium medicae]|nr:hypothetical protein [Sinorhizobium medicae]MDX0576163.1 hypothetical protein [Sinorhizobium medicae]MDX0779793.1 hypothetical protein [Sinorhizobium medicae]
MYFAMNRFHVAAGQEEAFEAVWKARDSSLSEMPDFIEFHLLRGDSVPDEGYTPFISKSVWKTKDAGCVRQVLQNWAVMSAGHAA